MSPRAQLVAIRREVKRLLKEAETCLEELLLGLRDHGISILDYSELNDAQRRGIASISTTPSFPCSRRWRSIPAGRFRTSRI